MIQFKIRKQDKKTEARYGTINTRHGTVETPNFMPVATQATVKTMSSADLESLGVQIIVCNTYHLMQRPGAALVRSCGGLHDFMGWEHAILTDSGGFQAYSLAELKKVNDEGITFSSHIDGAKIHLTPEKAVDIQYQLGADIGMCLDIFTPYPSSFLEARMAVERTVQWARRSVKVKKNRFCSA
jgi:queuine tRNA-ribosyltransferase